MPIYISRDDRYFQDKYQAIPKHGYTQMLQRMANHPNIKVLLNTDYREIADQVKFDSMVYTGLIDEFFDYVHGELPYRSLQFEFSYHLVDAYQEAAQVNYPNEQAYTRITEYKHITGQRAYGTTVSIEYPLAYRRGQNLPYYPVPREANRKRYNLYLSEAESLNNSVLFAGRLADYKYYNMDQAVARALGVFEKQVARVRNHETSAEVCARAARAPTFVRGTFGLSVGGEPQLRTLRRRSTSESTLGQTYRHFEVVVCDDSSSDGSCALIQGYVTRVQGIRLLHEENGGVILSQSVCRSGASRSHRTQTGS